MIFFNRIYSLLFFLVLISVQVCAQKKTNALCTQKLEEASINYRNGYIYEVDTLLTPLLKSFCLTRTQKAQAYRLLVHVYSELGRKDDAEKAMKKLLQFNPHYKVEQENDSQEFKDLFNSFRIYPRITIGLTGTFHGTSPFEQDSINILHKASDEYYVGVGRSLGINACLFLFPKLSFTTGVSLSTYRFSYLETADIQGKDSIEKYKWSYDYKQTMDYLEVPLSLSYYFVKGRFRPFFTAGVYWGHLISSQKQEQWSLVSLPSRKPAQEPGESLTNLADRQVWGNLFGIGFMYRSKHMSVRLEGFLRTEQEIFMNHTSLYSVESINTLSIDTVYRKGGEEMFHIGLQATVSYAFNHKVSPTKKRNK